MGGVDLLYHVLFDLRSVICGKKGYWPLVINAINIAFAYSWRLYCIVSLPQKGFTRHIVGIMIKQSKLHVISVDSHPTKAQKLTDEVRYDGLGHYPICCSVRKCAVCGKSCRNSCEKSKRSLHNKKCFHIFHEK